MTLRGAIVGVITASLVICNPAAPVWAAALIVAGLVLFIERPQEN